MAGFVITAKMLWPDGSEGGGEAEHTFQLDSLGLLDDEEKSALACWVIDQAQKIGLVDDADDQMECDAIDLTLSVVRS